MPTSSNFSSRCRPKSSGGRSTSDGATMSDYETILVEQRGAVTLVTLNRPEALNALNSTVLKELTEVFAAYDADDSQHCLVLTGSGEKAFAAGADIKEMQPQGDRKSTRLNSSHPSISYAVFCL